MSELFIVGTPIGNLGDLTLRAIETLSSVDVVACEDTRHTLGLMNHLKLSKPLVSCHANDEEKGSARILALLSEGRKVAYCSDAGTPGLSDPGAVLVARARAAGHSIVPIPGPSALATLVSASGFSGRAFLFDGFPSPRQGRRRERLAELLARRESFLLYESPYRIAKLVEELAALAPERQACLGRELTKIHEEIVVDTLANLACRLSGKSGGSLAPSVSSAATSLRPITVKGEFSLLVAGEM